MPPGRRSRAAGSPERDHQDAHSDAKPSSRLRLPRLYAVYAASFLLVTVASGTWMRLEFVIPGVLGGYIFEHALHAHSHIALFGWATMGLMAIISGLSGLEQCRPWLRYHAHGVGVASAAAFIGFLHGGYYAATIAISAAHVMLWAIFTVAAWQPIAMLGAAPRAFFRASLVLLCVAGAGAGAPGFVMARGITDAWVGQIAIHALLTPFMAGWLILAVMGAVYSLLPEPRWARAALWLGIVGVMPSALLHPVAPPPAEWLTQVGRAGTGVLGLGTLLFAADLLRWRGSGPLLRLAGGAAAVKGAGEVAVAVGIGLDLVVVRSMAIAYIHLVLLGLVTPVIVLLALRPAPARWSLVSFVGGLGLMLGALGLLGFPALLGGLGLPGARIAATLYTAALLGAIGIMVGAAGLIAASFPIHAPVRAAGRDGRFAGASR